VLAHISCIQWLIPCASIEYRKYEPRNAIFAPGGYADEACARKPPPDGDGIVDPVKNSAVREATTGDYLAFLPAYFSIGLRNPGAYTASVLNVCGPLIAPLVPFSYFSTPEQKDTWIAGFASADTKHELHLSFYKPDALEAVSEKCRPCSTTWRTGTARCCSS